MQRVIFLVDMNAFFISCEATRNPALADVPAAVAGDPKKRTGIVLAANYAARAHGVKSAMALHEALKRCPAMVTVPPDHGFYERKSREVMNLLSNYTPVMEQNSIDEAWLDMTGTEGLFGKPPDVARRIMDEIRSRLGLWCSVGIAGNKFLAKMASEMKKPLGITELWHADIPSKLWPLPVRDMVGIGGKTAEKLNHMGIQTIGALAGWDARRLIDALGKGGNDLRQRANGIDPSPVLPRMADAMQSVGRSTTFSEDITDIEKALPSLMELVDEIGMTVRRHDKKGRTVHITMKYSDFQVITRQVVIPATCATREIYRAACQLLGKNWNRLRPVRLIGVSFSGFDRGGCPLEQLSLFDGMEDGNARNEKNERLDRAMDEIRAKHGASMIHSAALSMKPPDEG